MLNDIIACIIAIAFSAVMSVIAFVPIIFEWKEEQAIKKASERYNKRFGQQG